MITWKSLKVFCGKIYILLKSWRTSDHSLPRRSSMRFFFINLGQILAQIYNFDKTDLKVYKERRKIEASDQIYVARDHFMRSYIGKYVMIKDFWLASNLVGCKMYGIKKFEANEYKNSLIGWCPVQFNKLILKWTGRK